MFFLVFVFFFLLFISQGAPCQTYKTKAQVQVDLRIVELGEILTFFFLEHPVHNILFILYRRTVTFILNGFVIIYSFLIIMRYIHYVYLSTYLSYFFKRSHDLISRFKEKINPFVNYCFVIFSIILCLFLKFSTKYTICFSQLILANCS